ncbi:putative ABC-type transport system, permease component [Thiomonas sp. X19]|uniref:ABC transporter permease n=1 Tax=Thiomonas sp. X19 TaxID=1050370 RepID=UPI000B7104E8|nr:FtsX-like permease family protein [Thiomonas sp. X19]SCC95078.1 putative ABC-type transport system, permease component [Thiomonas sp. X19]
MRFWPLILRDLRAAELRLMWLALVLATAALSTVGFLAQRLDAGLKRDAAQLIGGQAVVQGDHPLPPIFLQQARGDGLHTTQTAVFASMAVGPGAQGRTHLAAVKAVGAGYPLLGSMELRPPGGGAAYKLSAAPQPGTVWVDPGVAAQLHAPAQGPITLGTRNFRIAAVITREPDRGAGFINFAPRVMMNAADLPSTGLIQPASRVTYRLATAGAPAAAARFAAWAKAHIEAQSLRGLQVLTVADGGPELGQNLQRGSGFLQLVSMLTALIAAVAVAIAARDFSRRRLDTTALLKALGLSQGTVLRLITVELLLLGLLAGGIGILLGLFGQAALLHLLAGVVNVRGLPTPGWQPAAIALLAALALLLAFALPPVLQLARVPPLRVLRREPRAFSLAPWLLGAVGVGLFVTVLLLLAQDRKLALIALGGFVAAAVGFAVLAFALVWGLRRVGSQRRGVLALAARQLGARSTQAVAQISALGLSMLALMLVAMLRTGLLAGWQATLPPDAPNRFVINIQPQQARAFQAELKAAGIQRYDWYSMVRGRLVAVNGKPVFGRDYKDERARALIDREFNLSTTPTLPAHNRITAGNWQATAGPGARGLSVDTGIATTLGLKMGDKLSFDIAGSTVTAPITSLRKIDWGSMRVNFFVLMPRAMLAQQPATFITAFFEPPLVRAGADNLDDRLAHAFPDITLIDLSYLLTQVRHMLEQVSTAVQFLFGFALAAGLAVLVASLLISRQEREHETAMWRVLGASGSLLQRVMAAELLLTGALAGLLGTVAAATVAWVLARRVFDFAWTPSPAWFAVGTAIGAVLALAVGWLALRRVLRAPPLRTLQALA